MFPGIPLLQCYNYMATQTIPANTLTPVIWTAPINYLAINFGGITLNGLPGNSFTNTYNIPVKLFISAFIATISTFDMTGAGLGICLIDNVTGFNQGLNFTYGAAGGASINLPYTVSAGGSFQIGTIGSATANSNYVIGSTTQAQQNFLTIFILN